MSVEDKERLEAELKQKILGSLVGQEELSEFLTFNLKNFSYRYIESETTGELSPEWVCQKTLLVEAKESHLATGLKTENKETRKGLIDLAKSFTKKDQPCARYQIGVEIHHTDPRGGGSLSVFAEVNWDFPTFSATDKRNRLVKKFDYEDSLDLRNNFACYLEEVCTVL